jgi:putative SOS response-associated peptidase YedK
MCRIACIGGRAFRGLGFEMPEPRIVVPGNRLPVISKEGLYLAKWGVPLSNGDAEKLVYNARAEKVYRALVSGHGFWRGSELVYVPLTGIKEGGRWFALYEDREPDPVFALAVNKGLKEKGRVALVTVDSLPPISEYHHRQPFVVAAPEFFDDLYSYFEQRQVPLAAVSGW